MIREGFTRDELASQGEVVSLAENSSVALWVLGATYNLICTKIDKENLCLFKDKFLSGNKSTTWYFYLFSRVLGGVPLTDARCAAGQSIGYRAIDLEKSQYLGRVAKSERIFSTGSIFDLYRKQVVKDIITFSEALATVVCESNEDLIFTCNEIKTFIPWKGNAEKAVAQTGYAHTCGLTIPQFEKEVTELFNKLRADRK